MSKAYENLQQYQYYEESKSCYLDGRYFNLIFKDYPGLIENPLHIHIDENMGVHIIMANSIFLKNYIGLLRVIVSTDTTRHSMLVILDHNNKSAWIYDPNSDDNKELSDLVSNNIVDYIHNFLDYEFFDVITTQPDKTPIEGCIQSGVCNALVIKYAYNLLNDMDFTDEDVRDIRKFMSAVEANYQLPLGPPDIEYQWSGGQVLGTLAGAAIGGGVGAAVGGVPGALILGGLGGVAGYGIASSLEGNRYGYPYGYGYGYGYGYPYRYGYY